MLQNDFYTIIEKTEIDAENVLFHIEINPKHQIYEGHFPNNPVTPGVVQLEIFKELLCLHLMKSVKMVEMPTCKFLKVLNPETDAKVKVQLQILPQENGQIRLNGSILNDEAFIKMSGFYSFC